MTLLCSKRKKIRGGIMKTGASAALVIFCTAICFVNSQAFAVSASPARKSMAAPEKKPSAAKISLDKGRYLVKIAGCNECHTRGWMTSAGRVPEADWLTGDIVGWSGPWGTTYAVNLRQFLRNLTEDDWVKMARHLRAKPPMPWYAVRIMKEKDLRAIYRLIRHLGPKGGPAPTYLPPGEEPKAPYFRFLPPPPPQ
jgi:mono/diheme cytochrome c family protein